MVANLVLKFYKDKGLQMTAAARSNILQPRSTIFDHFLQQSGPHIKASIDAGLSA